MQLHELMYNYTSYVLMRDEKEERKKQARQCNTAHPRQSHIYTCSYNIVVIEKTLQLVLGRIGVSYM